MTTQLTVISGRAVFERALAAAEVPLDVAAAPGLHAPLDGQGEGLVVQAWNFVREALQKAYSLGRDKAQTYLQAAQHKVNEILQEAGTRAAAVRDELERRLREYLRSFIDGGLALMQSMIRVGERQLTISTMEVEQKIILGGDLTLQLDSAFKLAASGELTLKASYGVVPG